MSVECFIAGLTVLSSHMKDGLKTEFAFGAEHDIIHVYVDAEALPEDSDDGRLLDRFGFHYSTEADSWAYFT